MDWLVKYKAKLIEYVAIIVALSVAAFAVYQWGRADGKANCQEQQIIEVVAEAKLSEKTQKELAEIVSKASKLLGKIEGNSAAQTQAIVDYVQSNSRFNDCWLDADGIRMWNRENRGEAAGISGGADTKVSKSP